MSIEVFSQGDKPYIDWTVHHSDGLILNTGNGPGSSYGMVHRGDCPHVTVYAVSHDPNGFTQKGYIKVCTTNSYEIVRWVSENRPKISQLKVCSTCNPNFDTGMLPEEIPESIHVEGAKKTISVNSYERDSRARQECLEYHGTNCIACGYDFSAVFGKHMDGYIHVHHLVPLSEIGGRYEVDPVKDLIPLCPNCHAAIHHGGVTRTLAELKDMLVRRRT